MAQVNPYINFNGKCAEAMNFYKDCIGGELQMMPVAGSPLEQQCPAAMKDYIAHSSLTNNGFVLMATDMGPEEYKQGNNMAVSVNCNSEEEINGFYSKLSEGGRVIESLKKQFWGALFGVFIDKFGICWMLNYDENQQQ